MTRKINKQQQAQFNEVIHSYKSLKESKRSLTENIVTGLFVALFLAFVNGINQLVIDFTELPMTWVYALDGVIILTALYYYIEKLRKEQKDIFAPVFVSKNIAATIAEKPIPVKVQPKNAEGRTQEFLIFPATDIIEFNASKRKRNKK
jgi:hypothetical protein